MKQEDKQLLLVDLSARLPYGIILKCCNLVGEKLCTIDSNGLVNNDYDLEEVKPCLLPLSSMSLDQRIEYSRTLVIFNESHCSQTPETYDWLNKNHFDYRGLIERGLAIDATGLNIY